ncbi:44380_t:CDS:1, partial [Gigaspora margarita]
MPESEKQKALKEEEKLKEELEKALRYGDIIYNLDSNENIHPILKKNLPEIIDYWKNTYPEIKEALSDWKDMIINGELGPIKPIKSYNNRIFRGKEVLNVYLKIYPTSNSEKIKCTETCIKY